MLTPAELASALRTSTRQVQRWTSAGCPYTPIGTRAKLYDLQAVQAWLKEFYRCQSDKRGPEAGKSLSASNIAEYTDACRRVHLRVTPAT